MERFVFTRAFAVVLAAGLASIAGTVEAGIVGLAAPFTVDGNYGIQYLNFDGTSLTGSATRGANSITLQDVYSYLTFSDTVTSSNYAYDRTNSKPLEFGYGDVVSAATTDFTYQYVSTLVSDSHLTYFVVGFYNNATVNSFPNSSPDNAFIAGSNLAWMAVSRTPGDGAITIAAAGINTVAGGPITVGAYVAPSAVPEIDPATGSSALSLVAGVLAMIEQRRRRATLVA